MNNNDMKLIAGRIKLLPSLLASDFSRMGEHALEALVAGASGLHADVMDGRFVPPITFGADITRSIIKKTSAWVDAHLMIVEPERQIDAFAEAGVKAITVHAETCPHLHRVLGMIIEKGMEAGVAINPATPVSETIQYVLPMLDRVLIMSVNPGWGGQKFIPEAMDKIKKVKNILDVNGWSAEIQVDGGVDASNAGDLVAIGATELVAGTAVFKGDIQKNIEAIRESIETRLLV